MKIETTDIKRPLLVTLLGLGLVAGAPVIASAQSMEEAFTASDANGDGMLDVAEYQVYVDALADSGDAAAVEIKEAGSYSDAFTASDADQSGGITAAELGMS
ncbi:MAG: hypothetical protein AAF141_08575 [Pseudomonadota bacterium]